MKTHDLFDRYARLKRAVAEAYSRESCDERRFAELVMQLDLVEAQIAPLHALAVRSGDEGSQRLAMDSPSGNPGQRRATVWGAPSFGLGRCLSIGSPPPSRIDAVLRGASSMLAALTEISSQLRRRPEVGLGRRRRFHWFARGAGVATIDLPVVRLLP